MVEVSVPEEEIKQAVMAAFQGLVFQRVPQSTTQGKPIVVNKAVEDLKVKKGDLFADFADAPEEVRLDPTRRIWAKDSGFEGTKIMGRGKKVGKARQYYTSGAFFDGFMFNDDLAKGRFYFANGDFFEGTFKDGQLDHGRYEQSGGANATCSETTFVDGVPFGPIGKEQDFTVTHETAEYKICGGEFAQGKLTGELTVTVDDGAETKIVFGGDTEDVLPCAKAQTPVVPDVPKQAEQQLGHWTPGGESGNLGEQAANFSQIDSNLQQLAKTIADVEGDASSPDSELEESRTLLAEAQLKIQEFSISFMRQAIANARQAKKVAQMEIENISLRDAQNRLQNELQSQREELRKLSDEKYQIERKHLALELKLSTELKACQSEMELTKLKNERDLKRAQGKASTQLKQQIQKAQGEAKVAQTEHNFLKDKYVRELANRDSTIEQLKKGIRTNSDILDQAKRDHEKILKEALDTQKAELERMHKAGEPELSFCEQVKLILWHTSLCVISSFVVAFICFVSIAVFLSGKDNDDDF